MHILDNIPWHKSALLYELKPCECIFHPRQISKVVCIEVTTRGSTPMQSQDRSHNTDQTGTHIKC